MRSLQLTVMLQERKTAFIIMLGPLLDKLIQLTYFVVDAFSKLKAKTEMFAEQCCIVWPGPKHLYCKMFVVQCVLV